eukprot:scaffold197_cov268-Chaetoceros_neogracile.AAC.56
MSLCVSVILGIDSSISIAVATATLGYFRVLGGKILVFILRGSWGGFQSFNILGNGLSTDTFAAMNEVAEARERIPLQSLQLSIRCTST